jgi:hypothetical protein
LKVKTIAYAAKLQAVDSTRIFAIRIHDEPPHYGGKNHQ